MLDALQHTLGGCVQPLPSTLGVLDGVPYPRLWPSQIVSNVFVGIVNEELIALH